MIGMFCIIAYSEYTLFHDFRIQGLSMIFSRTLLG